MSLVITLALEDAIIMASDSRLSSKQEQVDMYRNASQPVYFKSDYHRKTRLLLNKIGVSAFGSARYGGKKLEHHFVDINNHLKNLNHDITVEEVAYYLGRYFHQFKTDLDGGFHVAGYDYVDGKYYPKVYCILQVEPFVYQMNLGPKEGTYKLGGIWNGETDIVNKLYGHHDKARYPFLSGESIPHVPWQMMGIQDGIDFCNHLIFTSSSFMRFTGRHQTIGGIINILVLKEDKAIWQSREPFDNHLKNKELMRFS